jgi:tetratricopeptide (TPR) repeat protein
MDSPQMGVNASEGVLPPTPPSKRLLVWSLIVAQVLIALLMVSARKGGSAALGPSSTEEVLKQGFAAQALGRPEDAEKAYAAVLDSDPNNKIANYNMGVIEQRKRNNDKSEEYYQRALSADPNFVPALFNLAIQHEAAGKLRESESLYRKIIELDPSMARAHLNLGFLLMRKLDREEEGKAEILRAIELDGSLASRVPPEEVPEAAGR